MLGAALLAAFWNFPRMALLQILSAVGVLIGIISCVLPGIFLAACWSLAPAAVILDHTAPHRALGRSFELAFDRRWTLILLLCIDVGMEGAIRAVEWWALNLLTLSESAYYLIGLAISVAFNIQMAFFDTLYAIFYLRLTRGEPLAPLTVDAVPIRERGQ